MPRLSYANAAIAEAVIVIGDKLDREPVLRGGLRMLEWLLAGETRDGHGSVVPVGGWGPGEQRPGFDQRPVEVAALADACTRAAAVTGDAGWLDGVGLCVGGSSATTTPRSRCSTSGPAAAATAWASRAATATRGRRQRWR